MKYFLAWAGLLVVAFMLFGAYDAVFNRETGRLTTDEWAKLAQSEKGYAPMVMTQLDVTVACVENAHSEYGSCNTGRVGAPGSPSGMAAFATPRAEACDLSISALDSNSGEIAERMNDMTRNYNWDIATQVRIDISGLLQERPALWSNVVEDCKP